MFSRARLCFFLNFLLLAVLSGAAKNFTVILDPGHGGKDAGAVGAATNEKSINLSVALKVRDIITKDIKDSKVVMTRDNDRFIPLQTRADIANGKHGDIFISIHVNSVANENPNRTSVHGASVYTLGLEKSEKNMEVARRENAVITMEPDYTTRYKGFDPNSTESYIMFDIGHTVNMDRSIRLAQLIQNQLVGSAGRKDLGVRQAPFYVLVKTSMPAVLVELDFICNPESEKYLKSEKGQDELAKAIAKAVKSYHESSSPTPTKPETARQKKQTKKEPERKAEKAEANAVIYKVQFLTSGSRQLPEGSSEFKGLSPVEFYIDSDGVYKYTYGSAASQQEAAKILKEVRKLFPQAFVIKTKGGKRIR